MTVFVLALAQTLGALLGDTPLRYVTASSALLASLGLGVWVSGGAKAPAPGALAAPWAIFAAVGAAAPLLVFASDAALYRLVSGLEPSTGRWLHSLATRASAHAALAAVCLLGGLSLPALLRLGGEDSPRLEASAGFGALAGAAAFALLLLPRVGILGAAAVAGLAASAAAFGLARTSRTAPALSAALCAALLAFAGSLERALAAALGGGTP